MNERYAADDSHLVEDCVKEDITAWAFLVKKYSDLIVNSIQIRLRKYGIRPTYQEVEDIKQETLTSIWGGRKLKGVRGKNDIAYWLSIVAGNTAIDYMRRRFGEEPLKPVYLSEAGNQEAMAELLTNSNARTADSKLSKSELFEKAQKIIGMLSVKERLIIRLNIFYGKKYDEIASILGIPRGTVSSYLKRAKETLKKELKDFI